MKPENRVFLKKMIFLALPVIAQRLLTSMVNTIDTMMIGGIGETAISAVAIVNKVFFVYQLINFGLTDGVGIYISQYAGANEKEKTSDLFNLGLRFCTILALLTTVLLALFPDFILGLFVKNELVLILSRQYLFIILFTLIPFAWANAISMMCRIYLLPKVSFWASILSCVVNVFLNAVFIYGLFGFPKMGVAGAALATLASRLTELIFLSVIAGKIIPEAKVKFKLNLDSKMRLEVFCKALPLMGNECIYSVGLNLVFINYSFIAEQFIPAITIADSIRNMISVAYNGFSVATGVLIGQTLGSGDLSGAKEKANMLIKFAFVPFVIGSLILYSVKNVAPLWFGVSEMNYQMASALIFAQAVLSWTQGYSNTVYFILRSGGDMKSVLVIDGLFTWYGPVLFSFLCARLFHLPLLWAYIITEGTGLLKVVLATIFYRRGKWLNNLTK